MKYKKWTLDQKLEILSASKDIGIVESCRKYGVSTGTFYSWKKKHEHKGEEGLKVTHDTKSKELKQAEGVYETLQVMDFKLPFSLIVLPDSIGCLISWF
jgi:putative transposase